MLNNPMIFVDFDGTITAYDTLEVFITKLAGIDAGKVCAEMIAQGYSIKDIIIEFMGKIRSEDFINSRDQFDDLPLREGFGEFLDYAGSKGIPVIVLSGGVREMAERAVAAHRDKISDLWAADVDLSGEYVRFYSNHATETETVGKVGIIKQYDCDTVICVGDSYTDFEMAMYSDYVFAIDKLADKLEAEGRRFFKFNTFHDIIRVLENSPDKEDLQQ